MHKKTLNKKYVTKALVVFIILLLASLSRVTKFTRTGDKILPSFSQVLFKLRLNSTNFNNKEGNNKQGKLNRKSELKMFGFMILIIALLSIFVFSRTSYWTTSLVNLSIDNDFTLLVDVTNNRVGINTSDPTATLQVNGSVRVVPLASCNTIDTDANGLMSCGADDAGAAPIWVNSSSFIYTNASYPSSVNFSNTLFVNGSAGRVGINTANPQATLDVAGRTVDFNSGNGSGLRVPDGGLEVWVTKK